MECLGPYFLVIIFFWKSIFFWRTNFQRKCNWIAYCFCAFTSITFCCSRNLLWAISASSCSLWNQGYPQMIWIKQFPCLRKSLPFSLRVQLKLSFFQVDLFQLHFILFLWLLLKRKSQMTSFSELETDSNLYIRLTF